MKRKIARRPGPSHRKHKRTATRSRTAKDFRKLIGSVESGISDLVEHHAQYVLESLTEPK